MFVTINSDNKISYINKEEIILVELIPNEYQTLLKIFLKNGHITEIKFSEYEKAELASKRLINA